MRASAGVFLVLFSLPTGVVAEVKLGDEGEAEKEESVGILLSKTERLETRSTVGEEEESTIAVGADEDSPRRRSMYHGGKLFLMNFVSGRTKM